MGFLAVAGLAAQAAQAENRLESIQAAPVAGNKVELTLRMSEAAPTPLTFTVDNPARIALDLPDTAVAMATRRIDVKQGALDTVNVAEANGRTRVVLNVDSLVPYETRVQGNSIIVTLEGAGARGASTATGSSTALATAASRPAVSTAPGARSVSNVDFRRGTDGSGRVIVELTDAKVPADLRQEGGRIIVNFDNTALPAALMQRLDVTDFATPVNTVDVVRIGNGARLVIAASGDYEQLAYQSDNIYTIEIKPVVKLPPELQDQKEYTGERLTLNFQDIETRAVLQLLADTSGQNMVISDTVAGNVTLRLQNVPWDQALDVVMRTKGLDMRREGNVMFIAPAAEIAAREKELLSARQEVQQLSPLRTEYLQVNYAKAADLAALIKTGAGTTLLSERGSVAIDERTNTLLLQDTSERLSDIRRLVSTLDIPVRQVMIEARIVIVSDDYSRDLGVRFGANAVFAQGGQDGLGSVGNPVGDEDTAGRHRSQPVSRRRTDAVCGGVGDETGAGEPGGDGDEVLLGHADIEEALGKGVAERQDVGVLAEVRGQSDDIRARPAQRGERTSEWRLDALPGAAGRLVLAHGERAAALRAGAPGLLLMAVLPGCSRNRR